MKQAVALLNRCSWHPPQKRAYAEWHLWAEQQEKKGIKQAQCASCQRYFFPSEMGKKK